MTRNDHVLSRPGATGQGNPHGLWGYILSDSGHTANATRLARLLVPGVIFVAMILTAAAVVIAVTSPTALAGMIGGGSAATCGALVARRRMGRPKVLAGTVDEVGVDVDGGDAPARSS